jgi:hypothetical protein
MIKKIKAGPLGEVIGIRLCQLSVVLIHFLWCQRKRTKRKAPVSFGPSDCLALLKAAGIFQTRFAQTVKNP